ncbi:hypothetical protein [Ruania rhizosphaerae]|uniref:hypothetical protein n=1 Tax=Ruania rhizosphaerae TaxID=1840413 RepID=UPI00135A2956|nr:hypothetical protein [Ruania rhizosphaerae]
MPIIVGIDPSLTATGIARIDTDDQLHVDVWTITTKGSAQATLEERLERLRDIVDQAWNATTGYGPTGDQHPQQPQADLVLIETPAMSKSNTGTSMLNGLFWMLVNHLADDVPLVPVGIGQLKRYATGKGTAAKDAVLLDVARRYPHVDVRDNNQADALVLAAMGAEHTGHPIADLPKTHTDALTKVAWPNAVGSAA